MTRYKAFFGDGEKTFAFPTRELIEELERKTSLGIGGLYERFRTSTYSLADILEILRIGLIGGGTSPAEASQLVTVYGVGRPLTEVFMIADGVISTLFFGTDDATEMAENENAQVAE